MTLANKVTSVRFLLCIAYFALLSVADRDDEPLRRLLLNVSFVLFLVVAVSDLLDGYLARRFKQVTPFGRIADPLVDKILVCGSFIFFLTLEPLPELFPAWFVVVILGREFLVSGIRGAAEAAGIPFGASFWGKQKTLVQNVAVGTALCHAANFVTRGGDGAFQSVAWTRILTLGLMWLALVATVVSGGAYILEARKLLRSKGV